MIFDVSRMKDSTEGGAGGREFVAAQSMQNALAALTRAAFAFRRAFHDCDGHARRVVSSPKLLLKMSSESYRICNCSSCTSSAPLLRPTRSGLQTWQPRFRHMVPLTRLSKSLHDLQRWTNCTAHNKTVEWNKPLATFSHSRNVEDTSRRCSEWSH